LDPPCDIKLVLCRKLHLFLEKSTKNAATRAALFDSKSFVDWGSAPDPTGGAYRAPPDHRLYLWGLNGRGDGREWERRAEKGGK